MLIPLLCGSAVCERDAAKLFQDVLARKERADLTRNALSGFQRFRFLFSLPGTLEKSIQRGEFETAINDYARARSLFNQPETEKPVFSKFRAATEHRVQKLREKLRAKLLEKPPDVQEQKVIISHLVTLECDYDPAWECLKCHHEFITNSLRNCFQQFSAGGGPGAGGYQAVAVAGRKANRQEASASAASSPSEIQLVAALSDLLIAYLPDFWSLGMEYFGGKLAVKPTGPELGSRQKDMRVGSWLFDSSRKVSLSPFLFAFLLRRAGPPLQFVFTLPSSRLLCSHAAATPSLCGPGAEWTHSTTGSLKASKTCGTCLRN